MEIQRINEKINRMTVPYKDIFTTVYTVEYDGGYLLFDAASYPSDVDEYICPMLDTLGVPEESLKYVFISHKHTDHAGGLSRLLELFPKVTVISSSEALREKHSGASFITPPEGELIEGVFSLVNIPGHTSDSIALCDHRSKTLITGDSLQLYGLFGSEEWGSNICFPAEHLLAVRKLLDMDIENIFTAHDFHPYGYAYRGREAVENALDAAIRPLLTMKKMILSHPSLTDAEIKELYCASAAIPPVREPVFAAVRLAVSENKM